jgi:hypothetical protein
VELSLDPVGAVAIKRAESDDDRRRLGHEAAILQAVAHPGVVRLVGPSAASTVSGGELAELTLELAAGGDLRRVGVLPLAGATGLGAALATVVADLHHLGVAHGCIEESHVLLDADGGPILCGFGRSRWLSPGGEGMELKRADIRAVAALVLGRVGRSGPRRLMRCLYRAAGRGYRGDARWLARSLIAAVPGSHLPGRAPSDQADDRPRPRSRRPLVAMAAAAGLCGGGVAGWQAIGGHGAATATSVACPAVDLGCGPLPAAGGVMTVGGIRYSIGPGEVGVVGRWSCGRSSLPALLQVATGDVWVFDAWPSPTGSGKARLVARYPSAVSLEVRPARSGCDALVVVRSGHVPIVVAPIR